MSPAATRHLLSGAVFFGNTVRFFRIAGAG
jgi:hypothetical protein